MPILPCRHDRYLTLSMSRTALLVVDMQRDFLEAYGYADVCGEDITALQHAREPAAQTIKAVRASGLPCLHTREGHTPDLTDLTPTKRARSQNAGVAIGAEGRLGRHLVRGETGHDFVEDLCPINGEHIIDKPGYNAFHETNLASILDSNAIDTLLVAGVTTQCCVFSTIRDAVDRGYRCAIVEDACAAFDSALHEATLAMIASEDHLFGWITDSNAVVDTLVNGPD